MTMHTLVVGMFLEYGEENIEYFYQDVAFGGESHSEDTYSPIHTDADVQENLKRYALGPPVIKVSGNLNLRKINTHIKYG